MASKVQLTGGAFQDVEGNPLANGFLLMQLSQDGQVNGNTEIAAGREIEITLDSNGNISTSPAQSVWPNDVISPVNTFYTVSAYTQQGQLVWGPNAQQVFSTPSPYDVGAWVPASINTTSTPIVTYDIGMFVPGVPSASELVLLLKLERPVRFSANLSPSTGTCGTNATSAAVFSIKQNGTQVATLTFNTGSSSGVFSSVGVTFNAGDVLSVVAPSVADTTLSDVGILLSGIALN